MPSTAIRRDSLLSSSYPAPLWNPEQVLDLCLNSRCVGWAPSQGRECYAPIAQKNYKIFKSLLNELSLQRQDSDLLYPKLVLLAQYGLCKRNHQYQVDSMVQKWSDYIEEDVERRRRRNSRAISVSSYSSGRSISSTSLSATSPIPSRSIPSISTRSASSSDRSTPRNSPSISRVSTSDISSLHLSRSSTTSTSPISRTSHAASTTRESAQTAPSQRSITSAVRPTTEVSRASQPARQTISTPVREQSSTSNGRCTRTHVRRLSLDEECSICYEDRHLSECDPSELVWCRSGCGRSVHKSCFDTWRDQPRDTLACPICRGPWEEECDCAGCMIQHGRRRAVEDDCAICKDKMQERPGDDGVQVEDLTWCKDGCGKSVHQECFDVWKTHCRNKGRAATCVMCRIVWRDECEC